jgi:cyclin T
MSEDDIKCGIYTLTSMIAIACVFLATKVEETPKRLREVIDQAHSVHKLKIDNTSAKYTSFRTELLSCEKGILQTIAFELTVEHPYKFLLEYITKIGELSLSKDLAQSAWNFINDRYDK